MSLVDLIRISGGELSKKGWYKVKEPPEPILDDVRRIVARGKLEDLGFRVPMELRRYLDLNSEGELVEKQEIPEELQGLAAEVRENYRRARDAQNNGGN